MFKPESVLGNNPQKILNGFDIKTDHTIPASRPDLILFYKKKKLNLWILPFQLTTGQK